MYSALQVYQRVWINLHASKVGDNISTGLINISTGQRRVDRSSECILKA